MLRWYKFNLLEYIIIQTQNCRKTGKCQTFLDQKKCSMLVRPFLSHNYTVSISESRDMSVSPANQCLCQTIIFCKLFIRRACCLILIFQHIIDHLPMHSKRFLIAFVQLQNYLQSTGSSHIIFKLDVFTKRKKTF